MYNNQSKIQKTFLNIYIVALLQIIGVLERHSPLPRQEHLDVSVPEARVDIRKKNSLKVVKSTCRGEPRDLLKMAEVEPQCSINVREKANIR